MSLELMPAIDLIGGRVVRLRQGDFASEQRYARDPLELARAYAAAGASWLHLVDLDGARRSGDNLALIESIAQRSGLLVQAGGGIRSEEDFRRFVDAGVSRVVVGSLAIREPETLRAWRWRYGAEALCLALDARADAAGVFRVASAGWQQLEELRLDALLDRFVADGFRHFLVTDIARDGMLEGPNLALYRALRERAPEAAVQASGGVHALADLRELRGLGIAGVVIGKALLEGRFTLEEALAA